MAEPTAVIDRLRAIRLPDYFEIAIGRKHCGVNQHRVGELSRIEEALAGGQVDTPETHRILA
jgi:hypothetical protein